MMYNILVSISIMLKVLRALVVLKVPKVLKVLKVLKALKVFKVLKALKAWWVQLELPWPAASLFDCARILFLVHCCSTHSLPPNNEVVTVVLDLPQPAEGLDGLGR